jgi:hypothetical protein
MKMTTEMRKYKTDSVPVISPREEEETWEGRSAERDIF